MEYNWQPIDTAPKKLGSILGYKMGIDGADIRVIFWHDLPIEVYADSCKDKWIPPQWVDSWKGEPFKATKWCYIPKFNNAKRDIEK